MINLSKKVVLASNSPRRKQLLAELGVDFEVLVVPIDESFPTDLPPNEVAAYIATKKAEAFPVSEQYELVLCADTVVVANNQILNKPASKEEAVAMIKLLSGAVHQVYTAICMRDQGVLHTYTDVAHVTFRELSDAEIDYYIDTYKPFDKAGAYGIQEWIGMIGITEMKGSFYTVMGLPTHLVYQLLKPYFL